MNNYDKIRNFTLKKWRMIQFGDFRIHEWKIKIIRERNTTLF